jgi:hypothetical protein
LTAGCLGRYRSDMAPSILVFDFGADEALAQQARHKVDGWKQGFRLGNKMQLKFERQEPSGGNGEAAAPGASEAADKETSKSKSAAKGAKHPKHDDAESSSHVRVLLRLDFSDHEKLSQQRWLDRIPAEEPFKSAKGETIRAADTGFEKISALFESLD